MIGYLWLCKCTYTSIQIMTGHSPNTVSEYMKFYRELVIDTLKDIEQKIGGEGIIVEVEPCHRCQFLRQRQAAEEIISLDNKVSQVRQGVRKRNIGESVEAEVEKDQASQVRREAEAAETVQGQVEAAQST